MLNEPPEVVESVGNPGSIEPTSYHGIVHEPSVVEEIDQKPGGYPCNIHDPLTLQRLWKLLAIQEDTLVLFMNIT